MSSTYLGKVNDVDINCDLENEEDVRRTLETLKVLTGEEWASFQEKHGRKNLVFYRSSMFREVNGNLHFIGIDSVELPLNCSSCNSMFAYCRLPEAFTLGPNFDISNVTDTESMFLDTILPYGKTCRNFPSMSSIVHWLKSLSELDCEFDCNKYIKDHLETLLSANIAACKTKEDCDKLLERLGLK